MNINDLITVAQGDISDAWVVEVKDENEKVIDVDLLICKYVVVSEADNEIKTEPVEVTETDDNHFLVYLGKEQTKLLDADTTYILVIQIESVTDGLPKPINTEIKEKFRVVAGYID